MSLHRLQHPEGGEGAPLARPDRHLRRPSSRHHGQTDPPRLLSGEDLLRQRSREKAPRRGKTSGKEADDSERETTTGRDVSRNLRQVRIQRSRCGRKYNNSYQPAALAGLYTPLMMDKILHSPPARNTPNDCPTNPQSMVNDLFSGPSSTP